MVGKEKFEIGRVVKINNTQDENKQKFISEICNLVEDYYGGLHTDDEFVKKVNNTLDVRQLDYKAMWNQLEDALQNTIKYPPSNVSEKTQEIAIVIFNNILGCMKDIERDFGIRE